MAKKKQAGALPLLLSCEHGGCTIPAPWNALVKQQLSQALHTHRGYDLGALQVAKRLAALLEAPLIFSETSRLLVDLNRSLHHPRLMASPFKELDAASKQKILAAHYLPHREKVVASSQQLIAKHGRVLHIAVHSFTPRLAGEVRQAELGLLYDPGRSWELDFCRHWAQTLQQQLPEYRIRKNYPYKGVADGLTKSLRTLYPADQYAGIELEINQRLLGTKDHCQTMARAVAAALQEVSGFA